MRDHQTENDLEHHREKRQLQGMHERNLKDWILQELEIIIEPDVQRVARVDERLIRKRGQNPGYRRVEIQSKDYQQCREKNRVAETLSAEILPERERVVFRPRDLAHSWSPTAGGKLV